MKRLSHVNTARYSIVAEPVSLVFKYFPGRKELLSNKHEGVRDAIACVENKYVFTLSAIVLSLKSCDISRHRASHLGQNKGTQNLKAAGRDSINKEIVI